MKHAFGIMLPHTRHGQMHTVFFYLAEALGESRMGPNTFSVR
nr:MAG TPA: hypothetical protein [Caudoviricetes sp.]